MTTTVIPRIALSLAIGSLAACKPASPAKNQTQNLPSPSGNYVLRVPVETHTTDPRYAGTKVWKVTILDRSGTQEYKDEDSTMIAHLNIYWGWDTADQVWVYNSDDSRITLWTKNSSGKWTKHENQDKSSMPPAILPDHAR